MLKPLLRKVRHSLAELLRDPEERRLEALPRFQPTETVFLGRRLVVPDACTFLASRREIFEKGVYRFTCATPTPRIIDCGANIGMSVLAFKTEHPGAAITAFEPDPQLFLALEKNVRAFGFADVQLEQKAVWTQNGTLTFQQEGGHSGRIAEKSEGPTVSVAAARLRDLLNEPVDFLKIDVEGFELELLTDCREALPRVDKLFVEYHSRVGQPQRLDAILRLLGDAGFRYDIKEEFASPHPFVEIRSQVGFDLQLSVSCYRPLPLK
jgi:FkbM family methyltransferase